MCGSCGGETESSNLTLINTAVGKYGPHFPSGPPQPKLIILVKSCAPILKKALEDQGSSVLFT